MFGAIDTDEGVGFPSGGASNTDVSSTENWFQQCYGCIDYVAWP